MDWVQLALDETFKAIEEEQERPEDYEHELTDELLELPKEQLTDEQLLDLDNTTLSEGE